MKVLLTGSTGFVGRNLLDKLSSERHTTLLAPSSSQLDLLSKASVEKYLMSHCPDLIIHAAGKVGGIQANIASPSEFLIDNTEMGFNLMVTAKKVGVSRLLNLGSSCMYPKDAVNPLSEELLLTASLEPTNEAYALAKLSVMKLGQFLSNENFVCKTIIPPNLYGPFDHFDSEFGHLIPGLIARLWHERQNGSHEIVMWGSGKARREFMYIGDLIDAILFCISRYDGLPEVFNCGVGEDFTIREYYEKILQALDYDAVIKEDLSKPEGMQQKLMDSSILNNMGWEAHTPLDDGLKRSIQYFESLER